MNGHGNVTSDLGWLLDDVVNSVVGALSAVVLSADGLQIGKSAGVSKDDSDQLSAIASSLQSLAKGVSRQFSRGNVVQNMIEMERGYLFVLAAGRGACLALLADDRVDVVAVAYEMNRLVKRVGDYLAAAPRNPGQLLSEAPVNRDEGWYDESAGPLVRPYTITNGRTPTATAQLDLSTQVMALRAEREPAGLSPEHLAVVRLSRAPVSIAEIAAHLHLPLGVVRVLCGDLIDRGLVITRSPTNRSAQRPDLDTLQAVLDGLINL